MSSRNNVNITAFIDNVCCECGNSYASPSYLIKHMMKDHQIQLHPRMQRKSRPLSTKYKFVKVNTAPHRRVLYGCPSCWFYCPQDLERLANHIHDIHLTDMEDGYETPVDEDDASDDEEVPIEKFRDPTAEKEIFDKLVALTNNFKKMFTTK
jgi:Pyruvate/2-oxoacid:ferredoxin oxidoreductase delta subunit